MNNENHNEFRDLRRSLDDCGARNVNTPCAKAHAWGHQCVYLLPATVKPGRSAVLAQRERRKLRAKRIVFYPKASVGLQAAGRRAGERYSTVSRHTLVCGRGPGDAVVAFVRLAIVGASGFRLRGNR